MFAKLTVTALRKLLADHRHHHTISGYSTMKKTDLVRALSRRFVIRNDVLYLKGEAPKQNPVPIGDIRPYLTQASSSSSPPPTHPRPAPLPGRGLSSSSDRPKAPRKPDEPLKDRLTRSRSTELPPPYECCNKYKRDKDGRRTLQLSNECNHVCPNFDLIDGKLYCTHCANKLPKHKLKTAPFVTLQDWKKLHKKDPAK